MKELSVQYRIGYALLYFIVFAAGCLVIDRLLGEQIGVLSIVDCLLVGVLVTIMNDRRVVRKFERSSVNDG
ncbi:MAG TPA: hypothetical protein VMJ32_15515 [Pirellulales bacterium]|nr:hypothetical protein [Pirellulales bacterium]